MKDKIIVALVGIYPAGTFEKFCELFADDEQIVFKEINTLEKYAALTDAHCIILRTFKAFRGDIARNTNLKMICRWGVGVDSVDVEAASERGIAVCNTPGVNANAVSEHAVMLMLALTHNVIRHAYSLRDGIWSKELYMQQSITIKEKMVGLVGGGNIGQLVAKKVRALGAKVQYYDVFRLPEEMEHNLDMPFVPFEQVLKTSDIISLHIPLTPETSYIISKKQFYMMKQGAYLINTARGGLINEDDLVATIESGWLAGAGLDCVEEEPLNPDCKLLKYPNIIVTPHVGGTSADIVDDIKDMIALNIRRLADQKPYEYVVNAAQIKA